MQTSTAAGATHVGRVRANNEDAFAVADGVWAVADGLGGHAGGEVASSVAIEAVLQQLPAEELEDAFLAAHAAILEVASHHRELADMGTTLVVAHRDADGVVHIGNVGDSRAYLLTGGALTRLTVDDNHAQELVDRGEISAEQGRVHPGRFWLSRALGLGARHGPVPKVTPVPAEGGRLLLCSDGLNSELTDDEIRALLEQGTPQQAADALVEQALAAGGRDNVTVVVVDM